MDLLHQAFRVSLCLFLLLVSCRTLGLSKRASRRDIKDHYRTLGLAKGASSRDIKTAFRKLALQYHPDKNPLENSLNKFREVAEAYGVLGDKEKRRIYDNNNFQVHTTELTNLMNLLKRFGSKIWQNLAQIFQLTAISCTLIKLTVVGNLFFLEIAFYGVIVSRPSFCSVIVNPFLLIYCTSHTDLCIVCHPVYPTATSLELEAFDDVCAICMAEMAQNTINKKLPCKHIFHDDCLQPWFLIRRVCPTCSRGCC